MLEVRGDSIWTAPEHGDDRGGASGIEAVRERRLLLVCKSNLERQCLYNGLVLNGLKLPVETQATIELADPTEDIAVVLINIGSKRLADPFFSESVLKVIDIEPIV